MSDYQKRICYFYDPDVGNFHFGTVLFMSFMPPVTKGTPFDQSLNMLPQYGILIKSETPSLWKTYKGRLHDLSKMITTARAVHKNAGRCWLDRSDRTKEGPPPCSSLQNSSWAYT